MRYRILHNTEYKYSDAVTLCQNEIHLAPRSYVQQTCHYSHLRIEPAPAALAERKDYFGNIAAYFALQERHERLEIEATSEVTVRPPPIPAPEQTPPWEEARNCFHGEQRTKHIDASQYLHESFYVIHNEELAEYARASFPVSRPVLQGALDLNQRIHKDFSYDKKATNTATPVMEVFQLRRGVCQDFAHLMLSCLRSLGLAARYVSGYLLTNQVPGKERLVGADASHAWVAIYCPGSGWVELDPTNNQIPTDKHIVVGWGRDYDDVCPIKGVILGGGQHTLTVAVDVVAI